MLSRHGLFLRGLKTAGGEGGRSPAVKQRGMPGRRRVVGREGKAEGLLGSGEDVVMRNWQSFVELKRSKESGGLSFI